MSDTEQQQLPALSTNANQPLYARLKDSIRDQVRTGVLKPGQRVAPVRQISSQMGLAYSTVARGIRELVQEGLLESNIGGGTRVATRRRVGAGTIGLLGYASSDLIKYSSPCNTHLLNLLQAQILEHRRTVVYDHQRTGEPVADIFAGMSLVDGLILFGRHYDGVQDIINLTRRGIPVVWVAQSDAEDKLASINSANLEDTMRATKMLLGLGHQRIALIDSDPSPMEAGNHQRLRGYQLGMAQSGAGYDPSLCIHRVTVQDQVRALLALDPAPTALICTNAGNFDQLVSHLVGTPLEPGDNLTACVYDDDLWHKAERLGVSHFRIEQPWQQMAQRAVSLLIEYIDQGTYQPRRIEFPSRIVSVRPDGTPAPVSGI